MAVGSGIGASLGIAKETTPGTIVSPTRWLEFNSETLGLSKVIVQGQGLRGGGLYPRLGRRVVPGRNAGGDIVLDVATNGMGLLYEAMLGTSTSSLLSGTTYQQVFTPGPLLGKSLSVQKLVPQRDGTLKPFTYNGCKILTWSLACAKDQIATLTVTLDAWDEVTTTAAGTPSYSTTSNVFHFLQGSLIVGGTVATTTGVAALTGGTAVAGVTGATIAGGSALESGSANRYINGKVEQVPTGWRDITGSLDLDFINQSDVYDVYNTDAATAVQLKFVGTTPISGSNYPTLEVLIPGIHFDGETPKVGGPGTINLKAAFTGGDDGVNAPVQIRVLTSDATVS
jgi:hypothetical protein